MLFTIFSGLPMITDLIYEDAEYILKGLDCRPIDGATVFITGVSGLIGTHFLSSLCLMKEAGLNIKVTGAVYSEPREHTREIANRGDFTLCRGPWQQTADVIIHAACYSPPSMFTSAAVETIRVNTAGTQSLLDQVTPGGKFLFLSTSEVYSGLRGTVNESDIGTTTPFHPRACYIEGKRTGEALTNIYRLAGMDAKSARLSLAYGPGTRKHDSRALNIFVEKALTKNRIDLQYAGGELRSYCYVADAVQTLWNVLLRGRHPVYNVGGHSLTTIGRMAKMVGEITGAEVTFPASDSTMEGAPEQVQVDLSRAEEEFGPQPGIGLREGLERTVAWQRELYAV